jgi:hypothetical protein
VQVVYARIEMENIITYPVSGTNGESSSSTRADVYIRLYTDAGCSNPFTLTAPLTVVVAEGYDYSTPYNGSASGVNNESFTMTATQSSLFVGNVLLSSYGTYIDPYSGSGYITESYSYSYDTAVSPNGSYTPAATYPN